MLRSTEKKENDIEKFYNTSEKPKTGGLGGEGGWYRDWQRPGKLSTVILGDIWVFFLILLEVSYLLSVIFTPSHKQLTCSLICLFIIVCRAELKSFMEKLTSPHSQFTQ